MMNDTAKFMRKSTAPGCEKKGEIAPAENHATDKFPNISDILAYCLLVNFLIFSSVLQP